MIYAATVQSAAAYIILFNRLAAFLSGITGILGVWGPTVLALFGIEAFIGLSGAGIISVTWIGAWIRRRSSDVSRSAFRIMQYGFGERVVDVDE
ncbi:hypothetical protein [Actinomadura opuntiae]|uniref:hypothetical protein n=1 Tax=Actinomadura sp. OS1-43 TaxID=604315 RepID=UPI00255B3D8D|nr:hypothetical protein [Actinomadura sp. OS1-43]MDL4817181.1 hypothetical protein [Actinomadura sp. OS1-43]